MLLHRHGTDVLRVKGMLNVGSGAGPVVVHGVQHLVHPPDHLPQWPDDDHSSRIVFIVRGLSREAIERSLNAFGRHRHARIRKGFSGLKPNADARR